MPSEPVLSLAVAGDGLEALIKRVVAEAIGQLDQARQAVPGGRLAWSEPEAAALLGLRPHVLRDERLRGRIAASLGPGRRILYRREDLSAYLMARRTGG